MAQSLTAFEFEYQSEVIQQRIRGLKLSQLECDEQIETNKLTAKKIDVETSKQTIRKSQLNLQSSTLSNDILEQKNAQLTDSLAYEKAMTLVNRETLFVQGKSAVLALEQAKVDLEQNTQLFQLKYRQLGAIDFNALGGK
ncbi:hypothetical protein [Floridanema evergladense]|uniref:Transporter n=1 Tax=Floridaenema evergladense BLCC-F167 TaxID=3153639 RepID=A0ABV4WU14_9CYAN